MGSTGGMAIEEGKIQLVFCCSASGELDEKEKVYHFIFIIKSSFSAHK